MSYGHHLASRVSSPCFEGTTSLEGTITMSYGHHLASSASIPCLWPCLEALILEGCKSLKEIDTSIGSLLRIVSLNLKYYCDVTTLPNFKWLEFLDVSYCSGLTEIQGLEELISMRTSHGRLQICGIYFDKKFLRYILDLGIRFKFTFKQ